MEESVVAVLNDEDKVVENTGLNPVLEVSVSFGRFENDLLSWEKWSTFSPNKYLEEVEKYATPGSVAQKRAYFEAHYKKIADRKTKLLEQEMEMEGHATVSNEVNGGGDLMTNGGGVDSESDISDHQVSAEEVEQNTTLISEGSSIYRDEAKDDSEISSIYRDEAKDDGEVSSIYRDEGKDDGEVSSIYRDEGQDDGEGSSIYRDEAKNDVGSIIECESSPGGQKEELDGRLDCFGSKINRQEEAVFVKEVENPPIEIRSTKKETQSIKEPPQKSLTKIPRVSKIKEEAVKSNRPKESKKAISVMKEQNISSVKKKQVSSIAKAPKVSTPKLSKTIPAPITPAPRSPAPRSSTSKGNTFSSSRSRNPSAGEVKKVTPKSLHLSRSLGTPNSDPNPGTAIRRSFIMESMGDKDIVKRAFKTFQNSFKQMKSASEEQQYPSIKKSSPEVERSSIPKLVPAKGRETKISTSGAMRKESEGLRKISSADSKIARVAPSQKVEGKSYAKAPGRTNLQSKSKVAPSQKLEDKFNAREGGRTNLQSKSKEFSKNGLRR